MAAIPPGRTGAPPGQAGWLRFHERKSEVHRAHPSVWSIPVLRKRARLLDGLLRPGARVLDIGAGSRTWESKVRAAAPGVEYRSFDQDRGTHQDYHDLAEVEPGFDLVLLIEVLEHLAFEDGLALLERILTLLSPGGRVLLTTPNTAHPTQYWQDPTHRTPWAYDFLGAALLELGYRDLRYFRTFHAKLPRFLAARALARILMGWTGLDYAGTIAVSAARSP
jgi:SAM-dependent methyltransferase